MGAVLGDGRQRDRTPDGLVDAVGVEVHLRRGPARRQLDAVSGGQLRDDVDEGVLGVEPEVRRLAAVAAGDDLDALADAIGLDVLEVRVPDGDGELAVAGQVPEDVVQ